MTLSKRAAGCVTGCVGGTDNINGYHYVVTIPSCLSSKLFCERKVYAFHALQMMTALVGDGTFLLLHCS